MKDRRIHFIGIGGIGMSGLAEYFLHSGFKVSGSDLSESHITKRLESLGAVLYSGHSEQNVNGDVDIVVYTSAAKEDNPELVKAKNLGLKLMKRAEMLGKVVNERFLIAVSGTHGKTTTTAMIGKLLIDAGLDPLIFVGGNFELLGGAASRFGSGKYAVVEADEYDRSFLTLKPDIAVITNIDEDHLDIYKDLSEIKLTFRKFCELSKPDGKIIYCGDDNNIQDFISKLRYEKIAYGFGEENYLRINGFKTEGAGISYSIMNSKSSYNDIHLDLIGKHNVLNSAACFAVSKVLGIDFETYKNSIANFKTVDRRLQLKYDKGGIKVYDDYAHHPKEIASSLEGLKELYKSGRLVVVFQPHLYSRTKELYKSFANELAKADEIILLDIYPAREKPIEGISSKLVLNELKKLFANAEYMQSKEAAITYLKENSKPGNIIVFQGAGDVTELCSQFIKIIDSK